MCSASSQRRIHVPASGTPDRPLRECGEPHLDIVPSRYSPPIRTTRSTTPVEQCDDSESVIRLIRISRFEIGAFVMRSDVLSSLMTNRYLGREFRHCDESLNHSRAARPMCRWVPFSIEKTTRPISFYPARESLHTLVHRWINSIPPTL